MTTHAPSSRYRVGIIGCGSIGSSIEDEMRGAAMRFPLPQGHAPSYQVIPRANLVAGADPDSSRRAAFASRWNVPVDKVYADYREMLAREHLDIVSIATPTPLHAEVALGCVEAGVRAIFLEKPVASTLADARMVVAVCQKASIPLAVNHTRRGDLTYRTARRLIDEGAIGELHSLTAHFTGGLMWIGTHAFDMLNYLNADRRAAWIIGHLDEPAGFDPGGSAYLVYENGVRGFVNASSGHALPFRIQAIGSLGEIVIGNYDLELWKTNLESPRRELVRHPFPQVFRAVSAMVLLIEELIDALDGGPPPMSNGETGMTALEMIVGLHASSQTGGQRIDFPVTAKDLRIVSN